VANLSKTDKLLISAGKLASKGKTEFSSEDLVVSAFHEFPNEFSMKGYPEYPDSNYVLTQVMGKRAILIVKGRLEKIGTKKYRLTQKGLDDLQNMINKSELQTIGNIKLERTFEDELAKILTSTAFKLFKENQQHEITFHQFCRFAGLTARDKWQKVSGKIQALEHVIQKAVDIGKSGKEINLYIINHNEIIPPDDLILLGTLFDFLQERFNKKMDEWKQYALK